MLLRVFSAFFLFLLCVSANAQLSAVGYKSKEYETLLSTKTFVLQTGDNAFDANMKEAMKEWKLTAYEFISDEDFKTKITDRASSFILPVTIYTGTSGQQYHYLALLNGGKKRLSSYDYNDMLAYAVINHFGDETSNTECSYRLANMVTSMVKAMDLVKKNDIKGNGKKMVDELMQYYRTQSYKIPKRILLVNREAIGNKMTEEEFGKIYPHKFEFCSHQKIAEVIRNKDPKYYYYQPTITLNKSMFVFDPATGEVLYGDYQMMGLNINKKNVEILADAIEGK
jgi:hypothetical protein